jgi:hypothetical protein
MTARQAELAELIASRRGDIASYHDRREKQSAETVAAEKAITEDSVALSRAESAVAEVAATRAARLAEVNNMESDLRGRRKALSDLHEARGKEEVRQTQIQLKIESLAEHCERDGYQVDLREFAPDRYAFTKTFRVQIKQRGNGEAPQRPEDDSALDEARLREIIEQMTRQLDAMGPVNLDAVQEYDELEERHTFLETQVTDLTNSRRELLDVIARINQTTEKLFAETFAQVRINFREMFAELFGGGRADLVLLDENDALNCGIDIIAKPPANSCKASRSFRRRAHDDRGGAALRHLHGAPESRSASSTKWMRRSTNPTSIVSSVCSSGLSPKPVRHHYSQQTHDREGGYPLRSDNGGTWHQQAGRHAPDRSATGRSQVARAGGNSASSAEAPGLGRGRYD